MFFSVLLAEKNHVLMVVCWSLTSSTMASNCGDKPFRPHTERTLVTLWYCLCLNLLTVEHICRKKKHKTTLPLWELCNHKQLQKEWKSVFDIFHHWLGNFGFILLIHARVWILLVFIHWRSLLEGKFIAKELTVTMWTNILVRFVN